MPRKKALHGEPKFKGDFFQLCMKRKLSDQDHSYKYSSSASRFEKSSRTTIKSLKDLDKIELTVDFVNDTDVLMKEMCNLGWNFNGMRMNSRNYVEEEDDRCGDDDDREDDAANDSDNDGDEEEELDDKAVESIYCTDNARSFVKAKLNR